MRYIVNIGGYKFDIHDVPTATSFAEIAKENYIPGDIVKNIDVNIEIKKDTERNKHDDKRDSKRDT